MFCCNKNINKKGIFHKRMRDFNISISTNENATIVGEIHSPEKSHFHCLSETNNERNVILSVLIAIMFAKEF